ncbi:tRNA threonylcarbamoyladenosine dehydratase [Jiulongibacter sediminis]|uniref:MoeB n=1 Tax=Jiulongibacter sediminis TaxID=1605367 RepID=A0A0P7BUV5_9BACT|nr:tRNA threonylcarbamoyladenosine dehydratase [Jiulongibacter sediminis]KPM48630.1 MoeB [Jiulongibacter sediminis]
MNWLSRTELLIDQQGIDRLKNAHVLVVGLGGVGSFAAEFICRAGVGEMTIVDGDEVDPTNINRQLPALQSTVGKAKVEIMAERLKDINPDLKLHTVQEFLTPDRCREILKQPFDYVMDCIDSLSPKLLLLTTAFEMDVNVVSSMGAGGKMDPTQIKVAEIYQTHVCKLARYVRKRIQRLGVKPGKILAVFSTEEMDKESLLMTDGSNYKKSAYGTISYMPAAFGGVSASVVIRRLLNKSVDLVEKPLPMRKKKKKPSRSSFPGKPQAPSV